MCEYSFWIDCLQSNHSIQTPTNPGKGYSKPRYSCRCDVIVQCKEVYFKTRTGTFGTLANSADLDQTPQNAVSDQGLHCLLELQIIKDRMK